VADDLLKNILEGKMAWCPVCKTEYREGFEVCSDCNSKLVKELEVADKNTDYDHEAYLITVNDEIEADVLESLLNSNGIPVLRKYREAGGYLSIYMGNSTSGIDIYVPSKLHSIAKELIDKGNEADLGEDSIQSEEEKELFFEEEKKVQQKRSFRAWIVLLFFVPGLAAAVIYFIALLLKGIFK
jgi:hypothetical protein